MSARTVIEHALRVYYADSRDPKGFVDKLLAKYDGELLTAYRVEGEKDTRGSAPQQGESTHQPPRPHALPESSFARARQRERIGGFFRCARLGKASAEEQRGIA